MPADAANRKTCRNELASLLDTAGIADETYGYETLNISADTALMIVSNGTQRLKSGVNDTRWKNKFIFEVLSFVKKANVLTETHQGTNWTEQDVADKLDDMDKQIADVIADNRVNANWSYIEFTDDFSDLIAGRERLIDNLSETIPFLVESRLIVVTYIESG